MTLAVISSPPGSVNRYTKAYIDWIRVLEMKGETDSVIQVAREGLSRIPQDYTVRDEVAETISRISRIGEKLGDKKLILEGYRECFYSNPSIRYLLDLYLTAVECGCFEEIRDMVEQRIMELRSKNKIPTTNYYDSKQNRSFATEGVLFNALLLAGKHENVFEMCKSLGPLGWSASDNPKPVFAVYMMIILTKDGKHSKVLYKQWDRAIANTGLGANEEYVKKYRKLIDNIKGSIQLTPEQEEFYLKWCEDEIGLRVDAIVGNQHRGSYHKAAELLVAMAETLANRQKKQEGMDLIERYRSKYPRHIAFKSEVKEALQASGLFDVIASRKGK